MKDQKRYWNGVADEKDFPTPFHLKKFQQYTTKEMKILDVGCGYGRTLNELHNRGYFNLMGIDYAQNMINRGLRIHPHLNLIRNNGKQIPFPDGEFDALILIGVLTSNIEDDKQEKLILEIQRVLKPHGILYLTDFLLNNDKRNLKRYQKYLNTYDIYGVFELDEGAVLRHHSQDHIFKLTRGFKRLVFRKKIYNTMNGHKSNGFYYIGVKK